MRQLVQEKIIAQFKNGIDELGLNVINYNRKILGKPTVQEPYLDAIPPDFELIKNPDFDIKKLSNELTDEELLIVLGSQACLMYR